MTSRETEEILEMYRDTYSGYQPICECTAPKSDWPEDDETEQRYDSRVEAAMATERPKNKYQRECNGAIIDVYDVLVVFNVTNPATAHAIKKLLMPGVRGHKDKLTDLKEAKESIDRAIELEGLR